MRTINHTLGLLYYVKCVAMLKCCVTHTPNTNYLVLMCSTIIHYVVEPLARDSRFVECFNVQYVTLQKKKFTFEFSYLLFSNPTHKIKTGIANWLEITNSNPPRPIKLSKCLTSSVSIGVHFTNLSKLCKIVGYSTILLHQTGIF